MKKDHKVENEYAEEIEQWNIYISCGKELY